MAGISLWKNGLPYSVDIAKLNDVFPVPTLTEGRTITHEEIEKVIGYKRGSPRYYGVVNSWISSQKHQNAIFMVWTPGMGVRVLDPSGILSHGETKIQQKIRQTRRAIKILPWVNRDRLDPIGQKRLDHQVVAAAKLAEALNSGKKELSVDLAPVKSLPKPRLQDAS
jgi:hypothetical protein